MKVLVAIFAAVFALTSLAEPLKGAGWFWDVGNGLGFGAFAGLLYLTLTSSGRIDLRAHQVLGYGVLAVAVAHAYWFMLGDGAVIEFLKIGAPDYMWHGVVSIILLGFLMTVALVPDRFRVHRDYPAFRYWHRVIAVSTIATATYHIVVSKFYLGSWHQGMLFAALALAVCFGRAFSRRLGELPVTGAAAYIIVSLVFAAFFAAMRNLSA